MLQPEHLSLSLFCRLTVLQMSSASACVLTPAAVPQDLELVCGESLAEHACSAGRLTSEHTVASLCKLMLSLL